MARLINLILISICIISSPGRISEARLETGDFRVANDKWIQRVSGHIIPYDKPVHLLVYMGFGLAAGGLLAKRKRRAFWIYTALMFLAGLLWEVKDAYVYWETAPYVSLGPLCINVGGDGFSWKDLVANTVGYLAGILPPVLIHRLTEKRKAPQ